MALVGEWFLPLFWKSELATRQFLASPGAQCTTGFGFDCLGCHICFPPLVFFTDTRVQVIHLAGPDIIEFPVKNRVGEFVLSPTLISYVLLDDDQIAGHVLCGITDEKEDRRQNLVCSAGLMERRPVLRATL